MCSRVPGNGQHLLVDDGIDDHGGFFRLAQDVRVRQFLQQQKHRDGNILPTSETSQTRKGKRDYSITVLKYVPKKRFALARGDVLQFLYFVLTLATHRVLVGQKPQQRRHGPSVD